MLVGKPIDMVKSDDTVVFGLTNRIKENRLIFLETDSRNKRNLKKIMKMWFDPKLHTVAIFKTRKGFHIICFNKFSKDFVETLSFELRGRLDRYHVGYSIAKGFSTLRISKRWNKDNIKLIGLSVGSEPISRPHWDIYIKEITKNLYKTYKSPKTKEGLKSKESPFPFFDFDPGLLSEHSILNKEKVFFDDGFEIVGYIIDSKTYKKKARVGMIINDKGIRTIHQKD